MTALLILGNQLFAPQIIRDRWGANPLPHVFMREDRELCTYYRFHKQKIVFFLAAMRTYARELEAAGFDVHYEPLDSTASTQPYEIHLMKFLREHHVTELGVFEIEDKFFEARVGTALQGAGVATHVLQSPMFICSRADFQHYLKTHKKPFMKTFYRAQRERLNILVDAGAQPVGGAWSFDTENRLPLPKTLDPPALPVIDASDAQRDVQQVCEQLFADHPGRSDETWLPVDRAGAQQWLHTFVQERLAEFGPYEDALAPHSDFVYHGVLTPFLNCGLLTPQDVLQAVLHAAYKHKLPIQSVEGFVRQIIGWREFVRGIYRNFSETQDDANFWGHTRQLSAHWYDATTGIPPLDHCLAKVVRYGWAHHIERLMVVGSLMLLLQVAPKDAHRWFMEMFVDSSDWVMGPNVYGMALFSDGGIFATKPYICGSNYYRKMGGYKKDTWCDAVDGLYWQFIGAHREFFLRNPRLSIAVRSLEGMDAKRRQHIFAAADALRDKLTLPAADSAQ